MLKPILLLSDTFGYLGGASRRSMLVRLRRARCARCLIHVSDRAEIIDRGDASIGCRDRLAGRVPLLLPSILGAGTHRRQEHC